VTIGNGRWNWRPGMMACSLSIALVSAPAAFGTTATFLGPFGTGAPIVGSPLIFAIQGASLTQPTLGDPNFLLTIETNYGTTIPGSPDVIPSFLVGGVPYEIGDFLINWEGNSYAIVLSDHDGYTAGNLYQAPGFQLSQQVLALSPRPLYPVWLDGGGTQEGAGALSGALTGNGTTSALYTITDSFSAPAGFLATGDFTVEFSSAICANGFLSGTADFQVTGVPEPGTVYLLIPALAALPFLIRRKKRRLAADKR
jgi:hypothetical protein